MTYHVITILNHGARLSVDRGFLVCQYPDKTENRIALADVRAIVIGVPAVSFTNECLARLMAQDSLVLHCDSQYKPIGWTASFDRVIRREVFGNQIKLNEPYNKALWKLIVTCKMRNQAAVLTELEADHNLERLINKPLSNEANVSKQYWGHYFSALGRKQNRERRNAESFENKALNYGYAVISTLVHRAILIHGLLPSLGIHHEYRYRSHPLVYDLMEPFRPFVDMFLAYWMEECVSEPSESDFQSWIRYLMDSLRCCRIKLPENRHSHKLMDAIDHFVRSFATCFEDKYFEKQDVTKLWLPRLEHYYWHRQATEEAEDEGDEIAV